MSHNVLITGASGYLGGTLLARLGAANLPPYGNLYALVRTDAQAKAVAQYGAQPLKFDTRDEDAVIAAVVEKGITVVYFLIDALNSTSQTSFIKALGEVKQKTGKDVHFLHTSGAKIFSVFAGAPTDKPLLDTDPNLYDIQKSQVPAVDMMKAAVDTNRIVIEQSEEYGVRSYIFIPCIVYGKGEGFGNSISIQTVCIVRAAKSAKRVYRVDADRPTWPVCHVIDNTNLYIELLRKILAGENPDHGKNGYYLASSGSVAWDDLYAAMAKSLARRGVITDESVALADDEALEKMGTGLGAPKDYVPWQLGGKGEKIGWKPIYAPEHIIEAADAEVELILENI
ncbi:putative nad dependent epimerase dehydratase family protein [Eutypa lata UCREL1]|uniref:Putative nad dependent epimerase dehydratase family protein n=1 Tax=Eutypa lata (strain UCR-EL1) TaxID=1287681 RepID=M7SNC3_EUTLA|nr:putative nad dependent epimerase dehydratase family protein [Eutypa lata UCREL1]